MMPADRACNAIKHLTAERASRSYAAQWISVHEVARHLGIPDEEADRAVGMARQRHRIKTDGSEPPHSVSVIYGWGES